MNGQMTPEDIGKIYQALSRLEKIILASLDFKTVVQRVVDSMLYELDYLQLGYRIIVLGLRDEQKQVLARVSISQTKEAEKAVGGLPFPFHQADIPLAAQDNYCVKAMEVQKPLVTHSWPDILSPPLTPDQAKTLQEHVGIKTSMVYPLLVQEKPLGMMIFSMVKNEDEVSPQEKELLAHFTDTVALAVQNAKLYSHLESTTKELATANDRLKELDKLKDEFVSLASHELRTPMTAIKSYSWLVLNGKAGPLEPKAREYMYRVFSSTERLLHMINEMLDISRIESGRVHLEPEKFNLDDLAQEVHQEFLARAVERKLTLTISEHPSLPEITADREKIHQVFENIIGNAFKFTPEGGRVTVSFTLEGDKIKTSITDTGPGIQKEDMGKLFKKFNRLENTLVVAAGAGTGLGLFICKQYVELHSGAVGVESTLGQGTTFWFTLPVNFSLNPQMTATIGAPLHQNPPALNLAADLGKKP